jgi:hypothetical protein
MSLFWGKKHSRSSVSVQEIEKQNQHLRSQVAELSDNILYWTEKATKYVGNKYGNYKEQVAAANAMFNGTADWGCNQLGAVVESRVSFIIPRGFKVLPKGKDRAEAEMKFVQNFIEFNSLNQENIYHFATEGELDGKVLLHLLYDNKTEYVPIGESKPMKGMTSVRYISEVSNPYSVKVDPKDYMMVESATYLPGGDEAKKQTILEPVMVYRKFGGRLDNANETSSKVLKVLTQIENLDRALRDWREINHLYATPIPENECGSVEEASANSEAMNKANFKPGKMYFHTGKFGFAQPAMTGVDALYKEIVMLAEMISFNTGVPVHYWFPELATNRATAEDISWGLINSATSRERNIWTGLLEEMIDKAIAVYNKGAKLTPLRQGMLKVEIPVITREDWDRFTAVWLPLFNAKGITMRTLLSKLPDDLDVEAEVEAVQQEKDEAFERMKENGLFQAQINQDEEEDEDNAGNRENNFGR